MLLKKLIINSNKGVIRDIPFKNGLNLIVDETTTSQTETGNDVGKTTFLRAIDYCFGSDGKDIYTDAEFGGINKTVYNFLYDNEVNFELYLDTKKGVVCIKRGFARSQKPQIGDEVYDNDDIFRAKLKELCFGSTSSRPSIRQLMNKFIRIENYQLENTLKCCFATTTHEIYEIMYLFLFGFENQDLLLEQYELKKLIRDLDERRLALERENNSLGALKQTVIVLEKSIKELEDKNKKFELGDAYEKELADLKQLRQQISTISIDISSLEMKLTINTDSVIELQKNLSKVSANAIKQVYEEAKRFIPTIQKTFEEVLEFHNKMIYKKIEFINKEIDKLKIQVKDKRKQLEQYLEEEAVILRSLSNSEAFEDVEKIQRALHGLYEQKGQKESLIALILELSSQIKKNKEKLQDLANRIGAYQDDFQKKITVFNSYFSEYSQKLYDNEKYILAYDYNRATFNFKINNITENAGAGKKKAQITAFDLAYISFLNKMGSEMPKFVMHDKLEDIHINQLGTLFEIANNIYGQYVVAILRDKIIKFGDNFIQENQILKLSQADKFFKI